jgi:catechol 2,3-dioxygenase-like lactoylglutathione lyase family enzyme
MMSEITDMKLEYGGVHHLALVSKDMEKTVDFYTNTMDMKLVKAFDLGGGYGQHFFFDMGAGNLLAFFWFADAEKAAPGVASAANLLGTGGTISSAHGSMNHIAFHAPIEKIEAYRENLVAKGVECSEMINHADVETVPGVERTTAEVDESTWVRSFYFLDPDGIMLEFCAPVAPGTDDLTLPVNANGLKADGTSLLV